MNDQVDDLLEGARLWLARPVVHVASYRKALAGHIGLLNDEQRAMFCVLAAIRLDSYLVEEPERIGFIETCLTLEVPQIIGVLDSGRRRQVLRNNSRTFCRVLGQLSRIGPEALVKDLLWIPSRIEGVLNSVRIENRSTWPLYCAEYMQLWVSCDDILEGSTDAIDSALTIECFYRARFPLA